MNLVFIMVDNSFDGEVIKEKGSFISRKDKKYSGIGLKNVKYMVDKYSGNIKFTHDNNKFRVSIMLYENP